MLEKKMFGELFISIFIAVAIILISGFIFAQGDLTTYITAPMAIAEGGTFINDFSVQEFLRPNPQSFSDFISALFLKLGMSWQVFVTIAYFLQTAVFAAGIIAVSRYLCQGKNYWLMSSLLLLMSFYAVSGLRIGRNPIWYGSFYYAQSAFAVGVWGFYLSLGKKWLGAFLLFALATMLHFTVGAYCAAFVIPFFLYDVLKNKEFKKLWTPFIWIGVCIGIYLMMVVSGTTSTGLLSSEAFINIHCYLRHPHHHIPSSWESAEWINFGCYIAGVFLTLKAVLREDSQKKFLMSVFYVTTAITALILTANVLFVEIIPIAFIGKLQPARSVFIYRFFLAGLLAYSAVNLYQKKIYLLAAALIFCACMPQIGIKTYSGIFTLICSVSIGFYTWGVRKVSPLFKALGVLGAIGTAVIILWMPFGNTYLILVLSTIIGLMMVISIGTVYSQLQGNLWRRVTAFAAMLTLSAFVYVVPLIDIRGRFEGMTFKPAYLQYNYLVSNSLRSLAEEFRENSTKDVLFLGDPYCLDTSFFRLYSERSSVVSYKNMPFTDEGMLEWVTRLEKMGAVSVGEDGRYIENPRAFARMESADVLEYAKSHNAEYILILFNQEKIDKYLELGCSVFLVNDSWVVLKIF